MGQLVERKFEGIRLVEIHAVPYSSYCMYRSASPAVELLPRARDAEEEEIGQAGETSNPADTLTHLITSKWKTEPQLN